MPTQFSKQQIGTLECILAADSSLTETPDAVVILCHGFGAPGTDLVPLADAFHGKYPNLANTVFIFPAAPTQLDPAYDARAWWMIDIEKIQRLQMSGEIREMRTESPAELPERRQAIFDVIEFAKSTFGMSADKIVVGGFSQGSMLTTDVALHYPEKLGGLVVWSGALINEAIWKSAAESQAPMDVFQSHGSIDPVLPHAGAEYLRDMLMETNHNVRFTIFSGQHEIPTEAIEGASELISRVVSN